MMNFADQRDAKRTWRGVLFAAALLACSPAVAEGQRGVALADNTWAATVAPNFAKAETGSPLVFESAKSRRQETTRKTAQRKRPTGGPAHDVGALQSRDGTLKRETSVSADHREPNSVQMKLGGNMLPKPQSIKAVRDEAAGNSPVAIPDFGAHLHRLAATEDSDAAAKTTPAEPSHSADAAAPAERAPETAPEKGPLKAPAGANDAAQPKPAGAKFAPDQDMQKQVRSYCANITNIAMDARFLRQKKELDELRGEIDKRTVSLEGKIVEFKDWQTRREEFIRKARESLVSIYSSMKAEAAAQQLAEIDEDTASSVLAKLDARQSSTIMGEMEPKKAARLMEIIAAASTVSASAPAVDAQAMPDAADANGANAEAGASSSAPPEAVSQ